MSEDYAMFYDEDTKPLMYYDPELTQNIIIKLTHQGEIVKTYNDSGSDWNNSMLKPQIDGISNQQSYLGEKEIDETTCSSMLVKQFGRQLLSYDLLFDCLFFNSKQGEGGSQLRVPLTCMVDYKGFRALCTAHI